MEITFTPKVVKQYTHLPKNEQIKIKKKLLLIEENPLEGKKLSDEYADIRSVKAWPYRIVYYIDEKKDFCCNNCT